MFHNPRAVLHQARAPLRRQIGLRYQTTDASVAAEPAKQSFLQWAWTSPVGVKTVHFWAPVMKWGLVIAGIGDFARPAGNLSLTQNAALMTTGAIWTRWCFIIRPKNMLLAAVNFFLFCVGATQVSRIFAYRASLKDGDVGAASKDLGKEQVESAKEAASKAEGEVKKAVA